MSPIGRENQTEASLGQREVVVVPGTDVHGELGCTPEEKEELYRQRLVALREALHEVFAKRGIELSEGMSNQELVTSVGQLMGVSNITYYEDCGAGWYEEYEKLIQGIGLMTSHPEFNVDTAPQEVTSSLELN